MSNVKNVEAFNRLIGICTGYGEKYTPGSPNLRVESLSDLLSRARAALQQVNVMKTGYETATNEREQKFSEMKELASRILYELKSSDATDQTIADAALMVRKIRGRGRSEVISVPVENSEPKNVLVHKRISGSDFDSVVFHFQKLLETLLAEPHYNPTIPVLQVASVQQRIQELQAANEAVMLAMVRVGEARRKRNAILYLDADSMYRTASAVKDQVRALFGYTSETTHAATRIHLTNRQWWLKQVTDLCT